MDVWGYLDDRKRELRELSLAEGHDYQLEVAAEDGAAGQRGRLIGRAWLSGQAFVEMHEVVVIAGEGVHRELYAYFLCIGNEEIGGYERDPLHGEAPEHRHCSRHERHSREPAPAVSFKEAIEKAWDYLSSLYDER